MSDEPLTNAAVEYLRKVFRFMNEMERDELNPTLSNDFVLDDRRSGINYGLIDTSAYTETIRYTWDVGSGRPTWSIPEVIAVRGQRIAAITAVVDYGNDMRTDMISCLRLGPQLQQLQRAVVFDIDACDLAIAELDRMQAEIDAGHA